jgi:oxygen-independent coproporphyrinogen-3 oxidase
LRIAIQSLQDDRFLRPLRLISGLFYEESEVCFAEKGDLVVDISITGEDIVTASAALTEMSTGNVYRETFAKDVSAFENEKERFKQVKHTVSYVYLSVLQQLTGIEQKWGVLTGVRPTKLLHKKLQSGMTKEEAHKELREDYLIHDEKIDLMQRIVDRQLAAVPDLYKLKDEVSIYIGIPFCPTKCAYCTFPAYAINGRQGSVDSFLGGLHYEIREIGKFLKEKGITITTVYYGGGTPTSITAEEMDMLYEEMYESFPGVASIREVTVEAGRPDTITPAKLEVLKKWNIDRISINPQSYHEETLKAIGRHHTVEETIEKYHLARSMGMNNINMDLIIGLPGEGLDIFKHTLEETEKLMPESLTVHTLSFKRASEMTQNKRKYKVAGREEITEMMHMAEDWTLCHGYVPYYLYRQKNILGNLENVGYAIPEQESIYNIVIMEEVQSIIGLGCGASSKFVNPQTGAITHFANPKDPKSYNDGYVKYTEDKLRILEELFTERSIIK